MSQSTRTARMRGPAILCASILAVVLTGCGGGSSGGAQEPPANNPPSNPQPSTLKLTLRGVVTDEPIANAVVTATVGNETFTATAGADSNYSLDIEIAETNANQFVTLTAKGTGPQSFVEFVSLAGSFSTLAAQAGGDGVLSPDENFATHITNVSTAEAVLMQEANDGQPVTTDALLAQLGASLDASQVLELATAIKLAVDRPGEYPLPDGSGSILDVLRNAESRVQWVAQTIARDSAAFDDAQAAMLADPALLRPVSADTLTGSLAVLHPRTRLTDTLRGVTAMNRITRFVLEAGGTGRMLTGDNEITMTWVLDGSKIRVLYDQPFEYFVSEGVTCGNVRQTATVNYVVSEQELALLSPRTVVTKDVGIVRYVTCPVLPEQQITRSAALTIVKDDGFRVLNAADIAGARHTIYVYDPAQDMIVADIAQFMPNGTGSVTMLGKSFNWELQAGGRVVVVKFDDGSIGRYSILRQIDEVMSEMVFEISAGNQQMVDAGPTVYLDPELSVELTAEDVPGRYYPLGIGDEVDPHPQRKGDRLVFAPGGVGALESDYLVDGQVVNRPLEPGLLFRWQVSGGEVRRIRTLDLSTATFGCTPGTGNCVVIESIRYVPLAMDGPRVYVLQETYLDVLKGVTSATPRYVQNVLFFEYEPL